MGDKKWKDVKVGVNVAYVACAILAKGYNFINSRKLAKRLGLSGRLIGKILKWMAEEGYIELYTDRIGRFKVYRVKNRKGLYDLIANYVKAGKDVRRYWRDMINT